MQPTPRSVNELVEQRIQQWMAEQRRSRMQTRAEPVRPVITISREAGARGTQVGGRVAERLGFRLWDQELVQQVASHEAPIGQLAQVVDEHQHNAIEELLSSILMGDAFTGEGYVWRLRTVIQTLAKTGSAVVVGRGSQFVVAPESALRVRVVAPLESRVKQLAQDRKLSERAARAEVERIDHERHAFIKSQYHRDASDPAAYDLVVNTGVLSLDVAADVIAAAHRARFPVTRPA